MKTSLPHPVETCPCRTCTLVRGIEINRHQYRDILERLGGIVATRTTGRLWWKRYFVKLMLVSYKQHLELILRGPEM
jgi:hypothetical protein